MVREFNLINENGEKYSLMDIRNNCLLTSPSGLGYSYETSYEQVGNEFVLNTIRLIQSKISGEANFLSYQNYKNFVDYIETSQSLKLIYKILIDNKETEYHRDIIINTVEKTEKGINGILTCPVILECKSLWYEKQETIYNIKPRKNEKRWNFRWNARYTDYSVRRITFDNKGHILAPIKIEMNGYLENPRISILVNKEEYATITIPIIIQEYEKLLYSSKTGEIYIKKMNTDGTEVNLFTSEYIDITKNNIFKLPLGMSEIRLTADNDVRNAKISIFPQYKAV